MALFDLVPWQCLVIWFWLVGRVFFVGCLRGVGDFVFFCVVGRGGRFFGGGLDFFLFLLVQLLRYHCRFTAGPVVLV